MNKILTTVLLSTALTSYAQDAQTINKAVVCMDVKKVISELVTKYEELPIFNGYDGGSSTSYVILMNSTTKSWTIVQFDQNVGCVVGTGKDGLFLLQNLKQNEQPTL